MQGCALCESDGGTVVYRNEALRIIHAPEAGFPAFYRVVWSAHVAEFSDLTELERVRCMAAVVRVEQALRGSMRPDKINLAALGNRVPHLHWHIIGRFAWDSHFPESVWAKPERPVDAEKVAQLASQCWQVNAAIADTMNLPYPSHSPHLLPGE